MLEVEHRRDAAFIVIEDRYGRLSVRRPASRALTSILPEIPEPVGRKLCVPNRVLDVFVPKIVLQGARVVAIIGEFEAAGMAKHVWVHAKRHLRSLPKPRDHSAEASRAHRRSPLAQEYVPARLLLALKATQGAQFLSEGERLLAVEVAAIGDGIASKLPCIS